MLLGFLPSEADGLCGTAKWHRLAAVRVLFGYY